MRGDNVFMPVGFDAFGLPAENAAIKNNINPREWTMANIETMRRQLRSMGAAWDWSAEVVTCDPEYYRWNQWLFIQFLNAGLAYRAISPVDWCPNDGTLAREQVEGVDRHCWRCGAKVEKRELAQWYLRTTNYADELLDFSGIDWPDPIRIMQTNWIGRSTGAEVVFETAPSPHHAGGEELRVFTTRPDTLFGATFMVLAPEHPLVATLTAPDRRAEVEAYVAATTAKTEIDRLSTDREKTGVAIGVRRDQPGQRRAHPDLRRGLRPGRLRHGRDHGRPRPRRARLRVREAVRAADRERRDAQAAPIRRGARGGLRRAHDRRGDGQLGPVHRAARRPRPGTRSSAGWRSTGKGKTAVTYRLRDWLVSRQRYWGTPIPIIHCERCGAVPVPEDELPVLLPDTVDYRRQRREPAQLATRRSSTSPARRATARRDVRRTRWTRSSTPRGTGSATCRRTRTTRRSTTT